MTESNPDDARLRATEAHMRHALGLDRVSSSQTTNAHQPVPTNGFHPQRRRFVRDGDVPVSIIHRDEPSGTNQLEAARQTIRALTAAKEHAGRSLDEALAAVQHLQTELAHERLAKDEVFEAVQRAESERQAVQQSLRTLEAQLTAERQARCNAEDAAREAVEARQEAEERLRAAMIEQTHRPSTASGKRMATDNLPGAAAVGATKAIGGAQIANRRGRTPKGADEDADIVEWWVPGWREKFR